MQRLTKPMVGLKTVILLALSNVFMTFAWYAHLRDLKDKTWFIAALISWGIAAQDYSGGNHAIRVSALCGVFHEGKSYMELCRSCAVSGGGGVLHFPEIAMSW